MTETKQETNSNDNDNNIDSFNFESCGGIIEKWDDGHIPENLLRNERCMITRLVRYPHVFESKPNNNSNVVNIFSNAMSKYIVDGLYKRTVQKQQQSNKPWGDYVTLQQVKDYWAKEDNKTNNDNDNNNNNTDDDDDVGVCAAAQFFKLAMSSNWTKQHVAPNINNSYNDGKTKNDNNCDTTAAAPAAPPAACPLWNKDDLFRHVHGVAIWGLAANVGSEVPYHLDYAEQIRYETNIIVPPLLAGTLQCTQSPIQGGDFTVSLDGLEHYNKFGYKALKSPFDEFNGMVHIPYQYNQLTLHSGHLPHASTKIKYIEDPNQLRVIVGFNAFSHDVGPRVQEAPEHSDAFRRKVQIQRFLNNSDKKFSLKSIRQNNPALTKLLVLAKREKIKQETERVQTEWKKQIPSLVPGTVQSIMDKLSSNNGTWPTPVDVQVFLHHCVLEGSLALSGGATDNNNVQTSKDLIAPDTSLIIGSNR